MRARLARGISVAGVAWLAIAGTACSGSKSAGSVACDNPVSTTSVAVIDYAFNPACTAASAGATLTVKDTGAIPHTFTITGTSINVPIAVGESKQVPLTGLAPGVYEVVCTLHPQMKGALKVG
jgi:plastocyanin